MRSFFFFLLTTGFFVSCANRSIVEEKITYDDDTYDYRIAYNVMVDSLGKNYDVFTMRPDGSNKQNISQGPGVEWVYLAAGDKLFVVSDQDTCERCFYLYETDAYGTYWKKVSDLPMSESWMGYNHKENRLIVKPAGPPNEPFQILDAKTGIRLMAIRPPLKYFSDPIFSEDYTSIIFRGSNKQSTTDQNDFDELYEMDLETGELFRLTNYPKGDKTASATDYHAGPMQLYEEGEMSYCSFQNGNYSLFLYNPFLKESRQITDDVANEVFHCYSPKKDFLIYDSSPLDKEDTFHIFSLDLKTKSAVCLTNDQYKVHQAPVCVKNPNILE